MTSKNLLKKLKLKVNEVFAELEKRFPDIEIRNFDYDVLDRATSLVEDAVCALKSTCKAKYSFLYYFVFSLSSESLVFEVGLSVTEKRFKYDFWSLLKTDCAKLKPSKEHSLFVVLYGYNLSCNRSKVIEILEEVGAKEGLKLKIGIDDNTKAPIILRPETLYSFEIPLKASVLEYII